jgi:hypothetical protein
MSERKVLNSWKEIASYLERGVRTVQRYETHFDLPVRHMQGTTRSSVYAFADEIDRWLAVKPFRSEMESEVLSQSKTAISNGVVRSFRDGRDPDVLRNVLITSELWRRPASDISKKRIDSVLRTFMLDATRQELGVLKFMVRATLDLCQAHTAGFSTPRCEGGREFFRWDAMAGALAHAVGGTTPRDWSPCGITLDRQAAQLFCYPARYFTYFADAAPPIVEGLVLPVYLADSPLGTLWIVSHDESLKFNAEHVRVMNAVAHRCANAIDDWRRSAPTLALSRAN